MLQRMPAEVQSEPSMGPSMGPSVGPSIGQPQQILTRPLLLALVLVLLVLAAAAVQRWWTPGFAGSLQQLRDGDLEHAEREAALRRLVAMDPAADPALPLCQAMALVALGDAVGFAARRGPVASAGLRPEDLPAVAAAGLGDDVLGALLAAMVVEQQGDREAAAAAFARVEASSRLWHMPLARQLAAAGLARCR